MIKIEPARTSDVQEAAEMLVRAFAEDVNVAFFFGPPQPDRDALLRDFFDILISARLGLGMPVFVVRDAGSIGGVVMGYDTTRPRWPRREEHRWEALAARQPGLSGRFRQQDDAVTRFEPPEPHYYLGVVGVDPRLQGKGVGASLISHYCELSRADQRSAGTSIETANPRNAAYYRNLGFLPSGDVPLDPANRLWVLFRPCERN